MNKINLFYIYHDLFQEIKIVHSHKRLLKYNYCVIQFFPVIRFLSSQQYVNYFFNPLIFVSSQLGAGYWLLITHRFEIGTVPTIWRSECSSLVAHLSTVAESRVRIPAPCKYCKTASACSSSSYSYSCSSSSRRISKKKGRTKKLIN